MSLFHRLCLVPRVPRIVLLSLQLHPSQILMVAQRRKSDNTSFPELSGIESFRLRKAPMLRWMMKHEMCKSHKEPEHLWKQARFTSCQVINHVQLILVCGNLQRNGRPMVELLWFLYSSAPSPVDSDAMLKLRLLIVLHISIVRNARRAR